MIKFKGGVDDKGRVPCRYESESKRIAFDGYCDFAEVLKGIEAGDKTEDLKLTPDHIIIGGTCYPYPIWYKRVTIREILKDFASYGFQYKGVIRKLLSDGIIKPEVMSPIMGLEYYSKRSIYEAAEEFKDAISKEDLKVMGIQADVFFAYIDSHPRFEFDGIEDLYHESEIMNVLVVKGEEGKIYA